MKPKPAPATAALPVARRYVIGWLATLALVLLANGCLEAPTDFKDVCAEANHIIQGCGTTVPVLTDSPCTGLARVVSTCVAEQAHGCDDLASLMHNPDRCFPDAGEFQDPEELPLPERRDGGTR